jgi:hypothetical protein
MGRSIPGLLLAIGTAISVVVALSAAALPAAFTVTIDSPVSGSIFYSHVQVRGRVSGPPGQVESARWEIAGTDRGGPLDLGADGGFLADIPLDGLHANLSLTVVARRAGGQTRQASVTLVDRRAGPAIYFQSPRRAAAYGSSVRVVGQVRGPVELDDPLGEVASLSWSIGGTPQGGRLPFGPDGVFDFSFSTIGLHGPLVVSVRGTDRNGHASVSTLPLTDRPGGPALHVDAPADGSSLGAAVAVSGRVGDPADPSGAPREVKSLNWQLVGQPSHSGIVTRQRDGRFAFTFSAEGLSGAQTLELTAEDRNGRTSTVSLVLGGPAGAGQAPAQAPPAPLAAAQPSPPAAVTPAVSAGDGPPITIASPAQGGFYKDITIVEGRVGLKGSALKSFTYDLLGHDRSGRVAADPLGAFKLPLDLSDVTGDVSVELVAEDAAGRQSLATLPLHDGRLKPAITLVTPSKGSTYGSAIRVAGTVTDPYAGQAGMEGIETATWLLSPVSLGRSSSPARGPITLGPGGAFKFSLPAAKLSGAQDLTLTVISRNGNRADLTLRLAQGDSDLPSFRLEPGDRSVTATWEAVPFALHYDLVWAASGTPLEQGTTIKQVTPPVKVTGLDNGSRYSLQVKAAFDDGTAGASPLEQFIPLSPQTLAPKAAGEYQQIQLSWKGIPGSAAYDVWRASRRSATYAKVASNLAATTYSDSAVEYGAEYSYTISPAAVLAPMSAPASARSLAFPEQKLAVLGRAPFAGARGASLYGGYVFAASGAQGVRVVDVSTPTAPAAVAVLTTSDAWDVAVRGDYAYVADGESGLRVFDITAPRTPIEIGQRKTSSARAVVLSGNYAYVADGDKGLKVIDVSDARDLPRVGQVATENAQGLALQSGLLYVADGTGGLKVFDLKRPTVPTLVGTLPTTDARGVSLEGPLAVVADGAAGLRVLDISSPRKPVLLATMKMGMAAAVSLDTAFAYVADGSRGVSVVNLQDPSRPALFASQDAAGASGVSVRKRVMYIADHAGLDLVRVQILGMSFPVASCAAVGKSFDVSVSGNWAYVASHADGIHMIDVSQPGDVTDASLASGVGTRFAQSVAVQDRTAYVADGSSGVRIVDMSPAWTKGGVPITAGTYRPGGVVSRAVPSGKYLYVAAGDRGVQVLDVTTPSAPAQVSSVRTTDAADVLLKDTWAFVADGDGGVRVLDVSNPASPVLLPAAVRGDARRLAMTGDLLLAAGAEGVSIIDVSDPSAPRLESRYDTSSAQSVDASGRYAYVAEGYQGLTVLDLSRPTHPAVVSTCDSVYAMGVAVKGDYAIVADSSGLRVVQILIPSWLTN